MTVTVTFDGPVTGLDIAKQIGPGLAKAAIAARVDGDLVDQMNASLLALDPDARTVPYMLSGGTDAKSFQRLGIRCFGFIPLRLPPELDFAALFHGTDERVPVDALEFGAQVLQHFLEHC